MSRTTYIILTLLVLVLGSAALYFIVGGKVSVPDAIIDGSPFGETPDGSTSGGETDNTSGPNTSEETQTNTNNGSVGTLSHFFKISDAPVAGAIGFTKNNVTYVRYVDRATGHVFDVNPATLERIQIINTTKPQIYEALWKSDASGFLARSVERGSDTVENTAIAIIAPKSTSTPTYTIQSTLLRGSIDSIAMNTDGTILYSLEDSGVIATAGFAGDKPRTLYQSGFMDWRIEPANAATALIYSKASQDVPGYAYMLGTANGTLSKVLGPIHALTALPSTDARRVAYSGREGNSNIFAVYTIATKATTNLFPATLAEKCTWGKKSVGTVFCGAPKQGLSDSTIDSWYKGLTHYSDQIWKFDANSGTAELLLDSALSFSVDIDVYKPMIAPNEDYLFVTNKTDLSLWALKLD